MRYFILEYKTEAINYCAVCLKNKKYVKGTFYHNECGNWLCAEHGCKCHIKYCKTEDCSICYNDEPPEINYCSYCNKPTCMDHIEFCTECDIGICYDCAKINKTKSCKGCGNRYCEKHLNLLDVNGFCINNCCM